MNMFHSFLFLLKFDADRLLVWFVVLQDVS